jgi:hypothetical protein
MQQFWEYLCIVKSSIVLWGDISKCILHKNHTDKWLQWTSFMLHIGDKVAYYHPCLCRFQNIDIFWRVFYYTPWRQF